MRDATSSTADGAAALVVPVWMFAAIGTTALAGMVAGFSRLDHCPTIGCDFTTFHRQGQLVLEGSSRLAPGWRLPPFAALVFAPFGALPYPAAMMTWEALSIVLAAVLAWLASSQLRIYGPRARFLVAAVLVATSLPAVHDFKWGQVSLLVSVGSLLALLAPRAIRAGVGLGLLGAFKVYPLGYLLRPVVRRNGRVFIGVACALAFGIGAPLITLGPAATTLFVRNLLASAPGAGDWANQRSIAYYGGQSLVPSFERWFGDGAHVGLDEGAAPARLVSLPQPGARMLGLAASLAVLAVTALRLRREASPAHGAALCLTGVTLVVPPGWHHYFAFLPFAQAVALGAPRSSPALRVMAAVSWVTSAAPLALLGMVDRVYFVYSAWGGTTVAALLAWAALVAISASPASESTRPRAARPRTGSARRR